MYQYEKEREKLFTEDGQKTFLAVRDRVKALLAEAGAFRMGEAMEKVGGGDSWTMQAAIDRLVELNEIVELPRRCWAQYRVFTDPKVHNY